MHRVNGKPQSRTPSLTVLVVVSVSHEDKWVLSIGQSIVSREKNKGEGRLILCDYIDYLCPSKLTQGQTVPYCLIALVLLGTALIRAL